MKRILSYFTAGALALSLTTVAFGQTRPIGAGSLILDDGAGHTVTLLPPAGLTCSPTYYLPSLGCGTSTISVVPAGTAEGQLLYWNNTALAYQTINIGSTNDVLTSNGTDPIWAPGMSNPMTTTGDIIYGSTNTTPSTPARLGIGATGTVLDVSAGLPAWTNTLSSLVQGNITTVGTITSGTWNGTTIAVAHGGTGATTLAGLITLTAGTDVNGVLPIANGGTNASTMANTDGVNYYDGTEINTTTQGASHTLLHGNGAAAPSFSAVNLASADVTGILPVANGGTGANTLAGLITLTTGTDVNGILPVANGGTGANTLAGLITLTTGTDVNGVLPIANGGTNASTMANTDGVNYYDGTEINTTTQGASHTLLHGNGAAAPSFSAVNLASADVTGILPVANGGTGANTLAGLITLTTGTDVNGILPVANGGTGANTLAGLITLTTGTDVNGVLPIANGGTNTNTMANTYGVNYYDGTEINTTTQGASHTLLHGNGAAAPSFSAVNLASADVTGILPVANGGTGANTLAGLITLTTGTDVNGILPVANGGTGANTLAGLITLTTGTDVNGILPIANGGTNSSATPTAGGVGYGTGSAHAYTSAGNTGQILQSAGATSPTWSTATYPATTTINQLLYSSAANTVTGLATLDNGILATSATGVPSISQTPTLGVAGTSTGSITFANSTAASDATTIEGGDATAAETYILPTAAPAAPNYVLQANGTTSPIQLSWAAPSSGGTVASKGTGSITTAEDEVTIDDATVTTSSIIMLTMTGTYEGAESDNRNIRVLSVSTGSFVVQTVGDTDPSGASLTFNYIVVN